MKLSDYSHWIVQEIRESKAFTVLNVFAILINICVLIIFLSVALGIEQTTIDRIAEDADLLILEVDPQNGTRGALSELVFLKGDQRVSGIIPILGEFGEIRVKSDEDPESTTNSGSEETLVDFYGINHFAANRNEVDPRTSSLTYIRGSDLTPLEGNGIIISEALFETLAASNAGLSLDNYRSVNFEIVLYRLDARGEKEFIEFPARIVGIVEETQFNNRLAYLSLPLAQAMDDWLNGNEELAFRFQEKTYERFDIVARNLQDLETLREDIHHRGLVTNSIYDRIDDVRQVLQLARVAFFLIFAAAIIIAAFNLIITLTSYVLKRQKEIGILKSIGATDWQVQNIFVLHALYLSLVGSILGAITAFVVTQLLGWGIAWLFPGLEISQIFRVHLGYVFWIVLLALVISAIAAFIPARRAASITPIETLRQQ